MIKNSLIAMLVLGNILWGISVLKIYRHGAALSKLLGIQDQIIVDYKEEVETLKLELRLHQPTWQYVRVTSYQSVKNQTDSTPDLTAVNWKTGPGQVAVSRDLLRKNFTFGRKIWLERLGVFTITDIMNERHRNTIDVWIPKSGKQFKMEKALAVLILPRKGV